MTTGSPRARAARLHVPGQPVVVEEVDVAIPGDDDVVVEMAFAGVNPVDRYIAEGRVAPDGPLPRTLGMEGTGRLSGAKACGRHTKSVYDSSKLLSPQTAQSGLRKRTSS